jgi:TetR/AcrR family transcriptional regulator, transcriptional repressor for nem operon
MARPRQFNEEETLAAVRDEFSTKGFSATSMDDLMRVTGLGKGSIYAAFGDKHQIFLSALRLYSGNTLKSTHDALSNDKTAIDRLRMLFRVSDHKDAAEPYRGCFLANSTTELAVHDCDVRDLSRQTYHSVEKLLGEVVEQAQNDGDIPRTVEPPKLGRLLLAVMQGMEFLRKTGMPIQDLRSIGSVTEQLLLPGGDPSQRAKTTATRVASSSAKTVKRK